MPGNSHSNFIITGHGRSGTKFLSSVMNLSVKWTVLHEPQPKGLDVPIEDVQKRFNRDFYGEVNSYLRRVLFDLDVSRRGIILRDPRSIWLSIANRSSESDLLKKFVRLGESVGIIQSAIQRGAEPILFERMTTDTKYLQSVLQRFGIKDVGITEEMLTPMNETTEKKFTSIDQFPKPIQHELGMWAYAHLKYWEDVE